MRWLICLLLVFSCCVSCVAASPSGIPRELARERASLVSDLHYRLAFHLTSAPSNTVGEEEIRFHLKAVRPLLLDYRDGTVRDMRVNGRSVIAVHENGHLLLNADDLHLGENSMRINFVSSVAPAGKALIRYEDRDDGSNYIYTLFVPMDASMAFPCFDQPDLKGHFRLTLEIPKNWVAISNTAAEEKQQPDGDFSVHPAPDPSSQIAYFSETQPISTYLFAFAAGPFRKVHETPNMPDVYVRKSQDSRAVDEAPELQQVTADGIKFLADYFAQPFPFPKYDLVLIPGFAYGGMEHAGATFLREESVLFRSAPTHTDRVGRDLLMLHELTHQWFGDFTTMRWFDDLWLKEGFAQFMAYRALDQLKPDEHVWQRFSLSIKPAAYAIDSTLGTTPIYQNIDNLESAKSAYGAIVYSKAPGLLRQLAFILGDGSFRDGLRIYLKEHEYGNAEWNDLVKAFERASGRSLNQWASAWIRHRGMPQVDVSWTCSEEWTRGYGSPPEPGGQIVQLTLSQHDVLNEGGVWPMSLQILLTYKDATAQHLRVDFTGPTVQVTAARGKPCPEYVFANDQDYAYGRFLLDPQSQKFVMRDLDTVTDLFTRTLLWNSLWDSVREAQLSPRDYLEVAQDMLEDEREENLAQSIAAHSITALHRYITDKTRQKLGPRFETLASDQMNHANDLGMRIVWFRAFRSLAETESGRAVLKQILAGTVQVPGVQLRPLDRWNIVDALIALGDSDAEKIFTTERERDHTGDGLKYAYVAEAARPDAATKKKYFDEYLHNPNRPEDWVEQSLGSFNYWNESQLTAPYLELALRALPQVKRERKIFFVLAWLGAFIGGQQSAAADAEVHQWLKTATIDPDLRLKVLEVLDELDRTVKIKERYP